MIYSIVIGLPLRLYCRLFLDDLLDLLQRGAYVDHTLACQSGQVDTGPGEFLPGALARAIDTHPGVAAVLLGGVGGMVGDGDHLLPVQGAGLLSGPALVSSSGQN